METTEVHVGNDSLLVGDLLGRSPAPFCSTCWALVDLALILVIVLGNVLTILAVRLSRRLRAVISNHLILSLAVSDLLVGLAVLYHVCFFFSARLGCVKATCLLRFALLTCGCSASFLNVTAIAVDRYVAIVHPLKYPEYVTERLVLLVIGWNWCGALLVSSVPAYWNNFEPAAGCEFGTVMPRYYTVTILAPMFLTVWFSIFLLYWRIWRESKTHLQRWRANGFLNFDSSHWKSIQVVLLILGSFSVCWLPYVVLVLYQVTAPHGKPSSTVYRSMLSVALCNSGVNPVIYAWKNQSFRKAFQRLLRLRSPDHNEYNSSFKSYLRRQSELARHELELEAGNNGSSPYVVGSDAEETKSPACCDVNR